MHAKGVTTALVELRMSAHIQYIQVVNAKAADVYRYMNFDQIPAFVEVAATVDA